LDDPVVIGAAVHYRQRSVFIAAVAIAKTTREPTGSGVEISPDIAVGHERLTRADPHDYVITSIRAVCRRLLNDFDT
jgi:hypothetical protein